MVATSIVAAVISCEQIKKRVTDKYFEKKLDFEL